MRELIEKIPPWAIIAIVAHLAVLGTVAYLILLERKVASWVQDRIGPNRVGLGFGIIPWLKDMKMFGLGQPLADGLKFILKEDYRPANVDKYLFTLAPMIMIVLMIISIAVIPWGGVKQTTATFDVSGASDPVAAAKDHLTAGSVLVGDVKIDQKNIAGETDTLATITYRYPFQIASLNIGVLYILAVLSLSVYGVVIGGWASNNKYSFLGGLRATANMISYEVPLGLAILSIVVLFGTLKLDELVNLQAHYWGPVINGKHWDIIPAWNCFTQPLSFLMFLICIHAEANLAPFDTAEAEQELVGGYHTEYSSMRFALFFLAEYAGMITTSAVLVALFLGGWHIPWLDKIPAIGAYADPTNPAVTNSLGIAILRSLVFFGKTIGVIFIFMWTRWSLPRFRFDQIMMLAWRALIPISLLTLMATATTVYLYGARERAFMRVGGQMALVLFGMNVLVLIVTMIASIVLPAAPDTNRKIRIPGSRFENTPIAGGARI